MKLNVTVELVETGAISRGGKRVLKGEALVDGVKLYVTAYAGAVESPPTATTGAQEAVAKRIAPTKRKVATAVAQVPAVADDSAAKLAAVLTKLDTLPPDIRAALNLG